TNEKFSGSPVRQGEIIINSWLAEDLKARNGDRVKLKFYSMKMGRILKEDSATFRINKILPIDEKVWDQTLMPAFPGISDAVNCRDWESGTYIDLKKIRRKDEDYWKQYKGTPKAFISLEDGLKIWKNPFGECTSFRFSKKENDTAVLKNQLKKSIAPAFAGMKFNSVYEEGQLAAKNSTDFGGLFIGLGFFIIAAGILLSAMLYSLQLSVRHREIKLLSYLGFSSRVTFRIFFLEGLLILLLAGTSGAFGGVFYTKLIIRGLQTIWMPATGTTSLVLHLRWTLIILGAITGILISSLVLWQVQRKSFSSGKAFGRKGITPSLRNYSAKTLVVRHLMLHKMRHLGITGLLALGCFTILVTGLNRRENMKYQGRQTGTGGFLLQAEATLSLPQDIASRSSAYGMDPAEDSVFKSVRLVPVRQLLQSDASCLNLNRVANPTLAGIPVQEFIGRFTFIDAPPNQEPWKFLQNELSPGIIPGYIDETVLQWGLGRKTGDTIFYLDDKGTSVGIRISGTLKNSIFQGKILISDSLLLKHFPSSRQDLLLIDAGPGKEEQLTLKMENLFSDYGLTVIPAVTVLAAFDAVQNTYLSVFLLLGGLGMLIGTAGLCIFFVSDLNRRRKEIAFYHAIGFSDQLIFGIFSSGYFLLLISGITAGCLLSLLTIFLFSLHPVFDLTALIFIMIVFLIGISGIALPVLVFMRRIFPRQLQLE
ncbi:MAG: FtsX-like permease family protein, partial [Syntrophothermus sp.]